ncbi:MAG: hypothetical protein HY908_28925 [Myxococcales bacterium]|nr:hypothetical protein [Myxococcales bacterium]
MASKQALGWLLVGLGLGLGVPSGTSGCYLVTDLDRFEVGAGESPDDPNAPSSLTLTLRGMKAHQDHMVELRVIDALNFVQCRGVSAGLGPDADTGVTYRLSRAISAGNGPHRLDFYADFNHSGGYDGITLSGHDHAWRVAPLVDFPAGTPHVANLVQVDFQHNTQFIDLDEWPPGTVAPAVGPVSDAALHFEHASLAADEGHLIEVRIVQSIAPRSTVALYRHPAIPATDFGATIAGTIDVGVAYDVDVYLDANGNGAYDNPAAGAGDRGWRFPVTAALVGGGGAGGAGGQGGAGGGAGSVALDFTFDPASSADDIDVGAP